MRIIGHLDMDAFFASVEERDNPRFAGRPIVVGADPKGGAGRGVVSTANYKAREYGIRSALPISKAWQFAEAARRKGQPETVFLGGNMKKYGEVSDRVMDIVRNYASIVEQASVDEAYFDISLAGSYEAAEQIAKKIKAEIKEKEKLTASIGIGPNKLIAKIASDRQKPDGLTVIDEIRAEKFLEPLSLRAIPGVGPKTEESFKKLRIYSVKDAKKFNEAELKEMMGKWGPELYQKLRGRDDSPLIEVWEAKSIGEQETFEKDVSDPTVLSTALRELAKEVHERFAASGFKTFRTVALTVRFADFITKNRMSTLPMPASDAATLQFEMLKLFMPFLDARENPNRKKIRLIGVRLEKLA